MPHGRQRRIVVPLEPQLAEEPVVERQRVVEQRVQIRRHGARRRHARELRELVDQPLQRVDLRDDGAACTRATSACVAGGADPKWRRSRSADSWIGVSGFLISCARRRATSRHAATFCDRMSGVTSSKTSTAPSLAPPDSPCSALATAARWTSRSSPHQRDLLGAAARRGRAAPSAAGRAAARGRTGRARRAPAGRRHRIEPEQPRGRRVDRRDQAARHRPRSRRSRSARAPSRCTGAALRPRHACAARSWVDCSSFWRLAASSPAMLLKASTSEPNSSAVSGSRRRSRWPAPISRAAADSICTGRVMRFARYSPIHVAPTMIISVSIRKNERYDAGERLLEHAQLHVVLVGARHAPRALGEIAREQVGGDHDADRPAIGAAHWRRGAHQLAAAGERFERALVRRRTRPRARRADPPRPASCPAAGSARPRR